MDLVRFAVLSTQIGWEENEDWRSIALRDEAVEISSVSAWKSAGGKIEVLAGARIALDVVPVPGEDGLVSVPGGPRKSAEGAIESAAAYISVSSGARCEISSPRLPVAFHCEESAELEALRACEGVRDAGTFVAGDLFTTRLEPGLISSLSDREDGVSLLAGALATTDLAGTYRELLLLFERAFATSSTRLASRLASFMRRRPALAYTKGEVRTWILTMRGASLHADRSRALLVAADYRPVVHRMLFAAYDVLLNKESWHDTDLGRRELWAPTTGPAAGGGVVAVQSTAGYYGMEMLDGFGAFKMRADVANFRLGEDFWPQSGPSSMTGKGQQLRVVGASEFEPRKVNRS